MTAVIVSILLRLYLFTNIYQQSFYEFKNVLRFYYKHAILLSISFILFLINFFLNNIFVTVLGYIVVIFE
jgi:hypothetical protein